MEREISEFGGERYLIMSESGETVAAVVSVADLQRLRQLDARLADRERAERRGLPWEAWEEELMLDDEIEDETIALRTKRTLKSVREHRRWIKRIADAARGEK